MIKKIRIVIVAAVLLFISVNAFSSEQAISSENITDEQMNWPSKYKMRFSIGPLKHVRFHLLDETYTQEAEELNTVIALCDEKTKDLFGKFVNKVKEVKGRGSIYYDAIPGLEKLGNKTVESYNAFIESESIESKRVREYFKKFHLKEEQERQEDLARKKSITTFFGLKFKASFILFPDIGWGLYFAFLFPTNENLKIGFAFDLMYRTISGLIYDSSSYLGFDLFFSLKIKWFNINIGVGIYKRLSSEIALPVLSFDSGYLKVSDYEFSAICSIGYMYDKKFKFFGGIGYRLVLNKSIVEYNSFGQEKKSDTLSGTFTFEIAFGF